MFHGLTFDFHGESKRRLRTPKYFLSAYKNDPRRDRQQPAGTHQYEQIPAHPEALKWLLNLNPNDFTKFFQNHKVGEKFSQPLINALLSTQQMVRSKQHQNVSTVDIMRHIRSLYPTGKYGEE